MQLYPAGVPEAMYVAGIDLSILSLDELKAVADYANKEVERKSNEAKRETVRQMKELARQAGITEQEFATLFAGTKTKAAVKYRNPEDSSQTWSGRGKRPRWLQAELEKGKALSDFLI